MNFLQKNIHFILIIATLTLAAALLTAYLSVFINPNDFWYFAFFGLAAPFLILANLVGLCYWVIRWKVWSFVPMLALLLGIGLISPMFQIPFGKSYETNKKQNIKVLSYNVHMFNQGWDVLIGTQMLTFVAQQEPDIVCFQEFNEYPQFKLDSIESLLKELPYHAQAYNYESRYRNAGLAIFSKYKIIDSQHLLFENTNNLSMWVDLLIGQDTVRVFNNHLQSTNIDEKDRSLLHYQNFKNTPDKEESVKFIARKLRNNYRLRAVQADTISQLIRSTNGPVIVCGDFNDTPMSYTYRTMRSGLNDAFVESGKGYASTFRGFFNLLRIDYLFFSDPFKCVHYQALTQPWSDHNPVVMELKL